MIAKRLATLTRGQKKADSSIELSQDDAAQLLNVGVASVKRAATVQTKAVRRAAGAGRTWARVVWAALRGRFRADALYGQISGGGGGG